ANPTSLTVYTAASTTGICSKSSNITVTLSPINTTIAGAVSATQCESKIVNALGSIYLNTACNPIAKVVPAGTNPVAGIINTCVYIDPLVLPTYNAEPYLPRHFDILPNTNAATSTGQITLYFNDAEFVQYNANNGLWPDLPTVANGGNSDANRSNLRVTQYHGTPNTSPSLPNQYSAGTGILINPNDADIFWNGNYWEVKFDVAGFSGFYIHTNLRYALPVEVNYLNGKKQGNTHVLDWKVTCNNTTGVKINLQRSGNNTLFNTIYTINATALQCAQPFYYVDIKPLSGINYYRLQLTDATGKTTYSNTITLINSITEIDVINIAPNPINKNGTFKLNIAATKANAVKISIFDLHGRLIKKQTIQVTAGLNYIDFNISNVSAGVYSLIVNSLKDEEIKTIRFVK
ncbi:MAG: T9SS type A sorting domain-containing protein, partial [Ferruginibacter sp.]|nr:T9SS type A sorting domain-containing protein [Ferruginibacter sp.]